jgi:hypothetical protein
MDDRALTQTCDNSRCGTTYAASSPSCPQCGARSTAEHLKIGQATDTIRGVLRGDGPVPQATLDAMTEHAAEVRNAAARLATRGVAGAASESERQRAGVEKRGSFMAKMNAGNALFRNREFGGSR